MAKKTAATVQETPTSKGGLKVLLGKGKGTGKTTRSDTPVVNVVDNDTIDLMLALDRAKAAQKSVESDMAAAETALTPFAVEERVQVCRRDEKIHDSIKLHALRRATPGQDRFDVSIPDLDSAKFAQLQALLAKAGIPFSSETIKPVGDVDLTVTAIQQKRCCKIKPEAEEQIRAIITDMCCGGIKDDKKRETAAAKIYAELFQQESTVKLDLSLLPEPGAVHEVLRRLLSKIACIEINALDLTDKDADTLMEAMAGCDGAMTVETVIAPKPTFYNAVLDDDRAALAATLRKEGLVVPFKMSFRT